MMGLDSATNYVLYIVMQYRSNYRLYRVASYDDDEHWKANGSKHKSHIMSCWTVLDML